MRESAGGKKQQQRTSFSPRTTGVKLQGVYSSCILALKNTAGNKAENLVNLIKLFCFSQDSVNTFVSADCNLGIKSICGKMNHKCGFIQY